MLDHSWHIACQLPFIDKQLPLPLHVPPDESQHLFVRGLQAENPFYVHTHSGRVLAEPQQNIELLTQSLSNTGRLGREILQVGLAQLVSDHLPDSVRQGLRAPGHS